jgi:hypothetical protein
MFGAPGLSVSFYSLIELRKFRKKLKKLKLARISLSSKLSITPTLGAKMTLGSSVLVTL